VPLKEELMNMLCESAWCSYERHEGSILKIRIKEEGRAILAVAIIVLLLTLIRILLLLMIVLHHENRDQKYDLRIRA